MLPIHACAESVLQFAFNATVEVPKRILTVLACLKNYSMRVAELAVFYNPNGGVIKHPLLRIQSY